MSAALALSSQAIWSSELRSMASAPLLRMNSLRRANFERRGSPASMVKMGVWGI